MAGRFEIATVEHARKLAETMRDDDQREVLAAGHPTPLAAVVESMAVSEISLAFFYADELLAIWGVVPGKEGTLLTPSPGVVWMLSGTAVERRRKTFWKASKQVVDWLRSEYPVLVNAVDARYERALRWAKKLGFDVHPARPFGPENRPFHPITLRGF